MEGARYFSIAGLALVFLVRAHGLAHADEPSDNLHTEQIQRLNAKSEELTAKFQEVCARFHLKYWGPKQFQVTWAKHDPGDRSSFQLHVVGATTTLECDKYKTSYGFRDEDDQLVSFSDWYEDDVPELKVLYNSPQPPKWDVTHATEVAEAFRKLLPIPNGVYLSPPQVEFRQDSQEMEKHYLGHWWFTWWRTDSHENYFMGDHITFSMSEGYCPEGGAILLSTPFHEMNRKPMTLLAALKLGIVHGAKMKSSRLTVVIPMAGPFAGKEARLAWNIWYDPLPPPPDPWYAALWNYLTSWAAGMPTIPSSAPKAYPFSVWIDAHTGDVLGGDEEL